MQLFFKGLTISENFPSHMVTHLLLRLGHSKRILICLDCSRVIFPLSAVNDVSEGCQPGEGERQKHRLKHLKIRDFIIKTLLVTHALNISL